MLPVDLLRIPLFALSVATSICSFIAQSMALVSLPFLFEHTLGRSQVETGSADDALAAGGGGDRAVRRTAGRSLSGGLLGGCGLAVMAAGLAAGGSAAGASRDIRHRLAHADLRHRLRLLQHAEQPRDPDVGAAEPRRRRKRHAGDVAPARPERRSGAWWR